MDPFFRSTPAAASSFSRWDAANNSRWGCFKRFDTTTSATVTSLTPRVPVRGLDEDSQANDGSNSWKENRASGPRTSAAERIVLFFFHLWLLWSLILICVCHRPCLTKAFGFQTPANCNTKRHTGTLLLGNMDATSIVIDKEMPSETRGLIKPLTNS